MSDPRRQLWLGMRLWAVRRYWTYLARLNAKRFRRLAFEADEAARSVNEFREAWMALGIHLQEEPTDA